MAESGQTETARAKKAVSGDCSNTNSDLSSMEFENSTKQGARLKQRDRSSKSEDCTIDYTVVDNEEKLKDSLKLIDAMINDDPILAVDCEGDNLSRKGKLQLLSLATRTKTFLIDIQALKHAPFELGLRDVLENKNVKKLMFDCREDSDALFHQFKVKLDGVVDIQLLEVIKRPKESPARTFRRRSDRGYEVVKLKGLRKVIRDFIKDEKIIEIKEGAIRRMDDWGIRPLEKGLLEYAAVDVTSLFLLFDKLSPGEEEMRRLKIASKIYVDLKRSISKREFDDYENNCYLPVDVIPETGRIGFDTGSVGCKQCKRKFPQEEFSKTQLRKGNQLCRACKKVKCDIDTEENRQRQFEKEDDYDVYYSEDEYVTDCDFLW